MDIKRITRVTIVDDTGRAYEKHDVDVVMSLQDDGRTLKLFLSDRLPEAPGRTMGEVVDSGPSVDLDELYGPVREPFTGKIGK